MSAPTPAPRPLVRAHTIHDAPAPAPSVVVLTPVEVREWQPTIGTWVEWDDGARGPFGWDAVSTWPKRTRTTPIDVAALAEQPCPECGGSGIGPDHVGYVTACAYRRQFEASGEIVLGWTCPVHLYDCPGVSFVDDGPCPKCKGRGSRRPEVGVVVEQWRFVNGTMNSAGSGGKWYSTLKVKGLDMVDHERRLRVVRYGRPTSVAEVVGMHSDMPKRHPFVQLYAAGQPPLMFTDLGQWVEIADEPYAADLAPDQTVLLFDELHTCDEEPPQ